MENYLRSRKAFDAEGLAQTKLRPFASLLSSPSNSKHPFHGAFDSVGHQVLWTQLNHYGLLEKFVRIIQLFYKNFSSELPSNSWDPLRSLSK